MINSEYSTKKKFSVFYYHALINCLQPFIHRHFNYAGNYESSYEGNYESNYEGESCMSNNWG